MMGFYDSPEGIETYLKLSDGNDGEELVDTLCRYLEDDAKVLELGMGPGKDLDLLKVHFEATGSDISNAFLKRYQSQHPLAKLINLDAVTMDVDERFNGIYSNKVLIHLSPSELERSLELQRQHLAPRGVVLHSLWWGTEEQQRSGLSVYQYTEDRVRAALPKGYEVLELQRYTELDLDDSLYFVLKKT